jgi:hypothetical protein
MEKQAGLKRKNFCIVIKRISQKKNKYFLKAGMILHRLYKCLGMTSKSIIFTVWGWSDRSRNEFGMTIDGRSGSGFILQVAVVLEKGG